MTRKHSVLLWALGVALAVCALGVVLYQRSHTPDRLGLAYLAGNEAEKRGDLTGAASEYEKATALDPKVCGGYFSAGAVYERQSKNAEAISSFEKALVCFKGDSVHTVLGIYPESARKLDIDRTEQRLEKLKAAISVGRQ